MMWSQLGRLATTAATQQGVLCMGLLSLALTAGCSDPEEPKKDKCADVTCERGVCDGETGECANAEACEGDATKCLEGYECAANGQCSATVACDPANAASCARGECVAGACVDKDTCAANADCVDGKFCDTDSTCKVDPCTDGSVTCARGACETGTGMCLNANACTDADEATTCLEGFKCGSGGKCLDEAAFCAQLNCGRGVCDFDSKSCISATDCGGSDMKCVEGEFCNPQNTCQVNSCDAQMKMCDRGVCDRATAECINPATCTASANCLDGNLCVGGVCVEQGAACGAAGCEGNQVCEYDAGTLSAACAENMAGCQTSGDCLGERVCRAGVCEDAQACAPDALEPNDDSMTATALTTPVSANICGAGADFFTFDASAPGLLGRTLVVAARMPLEDVGAGSLKVVVTDKNGTATTLNSDATGLARGAVMLTPATLGAFTIEVSGEGAGVAGLRYQLSAAAADSNLITACMAPEALVPGMPVTKNSNSGASVGLISSCADPMGAVAENIYTLTVAQTSYVTLVATPAGQSNVALSVQTDCLSGSSELAGACVNAGAAGAAETFGRTLQPGTYFVVVQGPAAMTGGSYTLNTTVEAAICTQADNSCKDANTASLCNERGTAFIDEACDNGCDAASGRCNRPVGEACYNAVDVDETMTFTDTVVWTTLRNDFDPGVGGCVPATGGVVPTAGPDKVYAVDLPPMSLLRATVTDNGANSALYLLDDCADLVAGCIANANINQFSTETLTYRNDTMAAKTVYLVADIRDIMNPTNSTVTTEIQPLICAAGTRSCTVNAMGQDASQLCNATGTAYTSTTACSNGCDMMTGDCTKAANDTCAGALELVPGMPRTGDLGELSINYAIGSGCTSASFGVSGRDAVYKLSNVVAGERLVVVMDATFDAAVWLASSCDAMTGPGMCLTGSDSGNPEDFTFVAPAAGDYYIIAAAYSASPVSGTFTMTVDRQVPGCMLGTGSACAGDAVQFCDRDNFTVSYACNGTCSNGQCDTPRGANCFDARVLSGPSGSIAGTFTGATNEIELPAGAQGDCTIGASDNTDGGDTVYKVDLQANDLLELDLVTTSSTAQIYVLDSCTSAASCVAYKTRLGAGKLYYLSPAAKTVSVVVDNTSPTATATFTLNHRITPNAVCIPGATRCADAGTALVCNAAGSQEDAVVCRDGCTGNICADNTMLTDTCPAAAAAPAIGDGIVVTGQFSAHTNTINLATTNCGNIGVTTAGADTFYRIDLAPGEGVRASASTPGVTAPRLYFLGADCAAATCRGGGKSGASNAVSAFYINETMAPESIIVALDTPSAPTGIFTLAINKYFPTCTPGAGQCVDANTTRICPPDGSAFGAPQGCAFGCDVGMTELCKPPTNDTCDNPVDLTLGVPFMGNILPYAADYGRPAGCTSASFSFSGRDGVWRVPGLTAGQKVRITSNATFDSAFHLTDSCAMGTIGMCLGGRDTSSNPEVLEYTSTAGGDLYIILGPWSSSTTLNSGDFTLLVELVP